MDKYDIELQKGNETTKYWMFQEVLQEIISVSNKMRAKMKEEYKKTNSKTLFKKKYE